MALSRGLRRGGAKPSSKGAVPWQIRRCTTHYKLDAYRVACELADLAMEIAAEVPAGYGELRTQLVNAANACPALIAEGANRYTAKQKRQRFVEARGEAGEVAAHLERFHRMRFIGEEQLLRGLGLADRVCAMLTGLIKRCS